MAILNQQPNDIKLEVADLFLEEISNLRLTENEKFLLISAIAKALQQEDSSNFIKCWKHTRIVWKLYTWIWRLSTRWGNEAMIRKIKSIVLNVLIKSFSYAAQAIIIILVFNILVLLFSFLFIGFIIYALVNSLNKTNEERNVSFTRTSREED